MDSRGGNTNYGLWLLFILVCCQPLSAYKVKDFPFAITDIKVHTAVLDSAKYDPRLTTYQDFTFRDTCAIEYYEAEMIMNGKKQNLKFALPFFLYDLNQQHADLHIRDLPQYKGQVLPSIFTYITYPLLLPRPVEKLELYLHNRRVLASNVLLSPDLLEYMVAGPVGVPIPEKKLPTPKLSDIYNSSKAYPQSKLQDISTDNEVYTLHTARVEYCPCEYIPKERKLYIYDLRIVFHYRDELLPAKDIPWLTQRFRVGLAGYFDHVTDFEENYTFLWKGNVGRDYRDILISEYGIPQDVVFEKITKQD